LVAVVYGALRKSWDRQIRIGTAIMVVFGAAVVSTMVIFGSIMSMQLHGC
jgi:hypothetical protein